MQPSAGPPSGAGELGEVRHVAALVRHAAARTPDHPAVVDVSHGLTLSWAQLDSAADAEASRLAAEGLRAGDRLAVVLPNGAAFCIAVVGALRAGAVVVPVGQRAVAREVALLLEDARPTLVVSDGGPVIGEVAGEYRIPVLPAPATDPANPADPAAAAGRVEEQGGGESLALLVYTSGSTGRPRGVQLSHRALLANRAQAAALRPAPVNTTDRVLLALPLFHSFGLAAGFLQVCWAGATVVLTERFDPRATPDLLVRQRVSAVAGVPSMYRALLDVPAERLRAALAGVRLCSCGGAPLPPAWFHAFREATGTEIVEGYGLSEAGPVVATNVPGRSRPGSVGHPLPGVELRLVDAAGVPLERQDGGDHGEPDHDVLSDPGDLDLDPAEDTGMVALRGPNLFSGYWPDGSGGPDADGWFTTADVGYRDADGALHLVDRSTDLIIVNGFNVYPREVEQVVGELDWVAACAVVGVPDDRTGAAVKAVIEAEPGVTPDEEAVRAHCAVRLARFKRPTHIRFVDDLPRTATGKIARRALAEEAEAR